MPKLKSALCASLASYARHYSHARQYSDPWNCLTSVRASPSTQMLGPLAGTSCVIKDNIATCDEPTTCALKMLSNYTSPFEATVVTLLSAAGLNIIGKLNLDEFGMGAANIYSYFGATKNPQHPESVAGGSSGGSAAAVASGMCTFAIGTDTGGSVRIPASYCEVVGFKPSYGRISRWGVVPYAQSLDTVGILSKNVETVQRVFEVLNVFDEKDPTSLPPCYRSINKTCTTWTIGVPREMILEELSADTINVWRQFLTRLQGEGHRIRAVSVPSIMKLLPAYYSIATAEAASNLSRYDGQRYGNTQEKSSSTFAETLAKLRAQELGDEVQRRLVLGNYTLSLSSGNHLFQANQVRRQISHEFNCVFRQPHPFYPNSSDEGCDIIVSPTAISTAPLVTTYQRQTSQDLLNGYLNDVLVVPASLAGLPAISLPFGSGIGIQIMGQYGNDTSVLEFARQCQDII